MTYAQEIRKNRLEAIEQHNNEKLEDIFNWILSLIDKNTNAKNFEPIVIWSFGEYSLIHYFNPDIFFELDEDLLFSSRIDFFNALKKYIEKEEGFSVKINTKAIHDKKPGISMEIVVN